MGIANTKSSVILVSLKAKDEISLSQKMWANNMLNSRAYSYLQPMPHPDGGWITWYHADVLSDKFLDDIEFSDPIEELGK